MVIEQIDDKSLLTMKLLHYFITKKNYSPVIINGIENEIWLENSKAEFRIIRIITKSIYNNEQYDFDLYKMKSIVSQIKRKTFNPFMDVLTIYTEVGDNFNIDLKNTKKYKYVLARDEEELLSNEIIKKHYKDIKDNLKYEEEGINLISKLASDISKKNMKENMRYNNMFKQRKPYVTYGLIIINIVIFALMNILGNGSEDNSTLIKFGAIVPDLIKSGEYYRLITSAFLHIGIAHLVANMYSLYILGPNIEYFYGKGKFISIYLYSAVLGSLFTLIFQGSNTISAGASGAIFGLLGSLLYFGYNYRGYLGNQIIVQILPVVIINLFISFALPGISASAHIGGLIGGVASSFMLGSGIEEGKSKQINGLIITIVLTVFTIYLAFFN